MYERQDMSHALILADSTASEAQRAKQLFCEHQQIIFRRPFDAIECMSE